MSKKVISILLSAAMLVAMFCVGFGAVTASAADVEMATYYFLAPDNYCNTEKGAMNSDVGVWWWSGPADLMPKEWPGVKATPAPEVGDNVFKITMPNNDEVNLLIFNSYVNAGKEGEADYKPELVPFSHQTKNIDVEEDNYDGKIFLLALDDAHKEVNDYSGAVTYGGDWFDLNSYKTSSNYATYNFGAAAADTTATQDTPAPAPTGTKTYKAGDSVTVTYNVKAITGLGAVSSVIKYNSDVLALDNDAFKDKRGNGKAYQIEDAASELTVVANGTDAGFEIGINPKDAEYGADFTDTSVLVTVKFKATADFNEEDLGLSLDTTKMVKIDNGTKEITEQAPNYLFIATTLPEVVTPVDPSTDTASDTDTTAPKATDSDKASDTPKATDSDKKTSDSDSKESNDNASTSSDKKSSDSKTSSTSTTTTGSTPTVQTAGTFAVISLVVILMAAAGVVIYTRKKTEE